MAIKYAFVDDRLGNAPGNTAAAPQAKTWAIGTPYAVGDYVVNGGFMFRCSVAGGSAVAQPGPTPQYLVDNAATWVLVGPVSPMTGSEAAPSCPLGYIALAQDMGPGDYGIGEFKYVKFTGATAIKAGDFVQLDRFNKTATQSPVALANVNSPVMIGIAMGSHALDVATPTYGWVMIRGVHDGANVTTGSTAGMSCSLGAAVGRVLGTGYVANKSIEQVVARTVSANNQGTVEMYWPMASGR